MLLTTYPCKRSLGFFIHDVLSSHVPWLWWIISVKLQNASDTMWLQETDHEEWREESWLRPAGAQQEPAQSRPHHPWYWHPPMATTPHVIMGPGARNATCHLSGRYEQQWPPRVSWYSACHHHPGVLNQSTRHVDLLHCPFFEALVIKVCFDSKCFVFGRDSVPRNLTWLWWIIFVKLQTLSAGMFFKLVNQVPSVGWEARISKVSLSSGIRHLTCVTRLCSGINLTPASGSD